MTKFLLAAITIAMFTGCPHTGIDPIDDVTEPYKKCEFTFNVTNNSSHAIGIHLTGMEVADEGNCQSGGEDTQDNSVPSGQVGTVKADLTCRTCIVHDMYSVDSSDPNVKLSADQGMYEQTSGSATATCTDAGCTSP